MAKKVKPVADAATKFVNRASAAGGDYKAGVSNAGQTWSDHTAMSADTYAAGVQAAIGRGAFQKGVTKAGPQKYQTNASTKGANHYPEGIRGGQGAYQQNAAPYFDALSGIVYPPRRPRGDPANQARSIIVQTTLHTKRVAG
ncbi:MAG: hypothetical protein EPN91_06630 [Salinibacterium sp.]|nr:MAG: hypothetical protein EPN91_06630 [Salinibacterium sp.]